MFIQPMKKEHKEWIDNATYEDLLRRWRFGTPLDDLFYGETGDYFVKRVVELRKSLGKEEAARISIAVGRHDELR